MTTKRAEHLTREQINTFQSAMEICYPVTKDLADTTEKGPNFSAQLRSHVSKFGLKFGVSAMVSILRHHVAIERKQRDKQMRQLAIQLGGEAGTEGDDEEDGEGEGDGEELWEEPNMNVVSPERYDEEDYSNENIAYGIQRLKNRTTTCAG